ncbi:MAG TPA: GNAT family protein [Phototrophicaceae bacterium]|jgi:RimJ/RimL family protein N-acetyltransferase|nr:GNAT family protein [Phototrophicaceae bacterium]
MLKGERLILRSMTRDDLTRLCEFNNDLEVELAGGGDPPIPQALERLQADFDRDASSGGRDGAVFAIEADGKFIGQCALFNFDTTGHTCELGITIGDPEYRGRGYGRETVALLLDYAFRLRNFRKVWLRVHASNERAWRAYKACGFIEEGRLRAHVWSNGTYDDLMMMGVLHVEWERQHSS